MCDKKFDPMKPVQTRDGRKARILCTDLEKHPGGATIVAAISSTYESVWYFQPDGKAYSGRENPVDLVNIPERTYQYTNMFYGGEGFSKGGTFTEKELALAAKGYLKNYAFTIEHTFEDGKLIDSEVIR